MSEITPWTLEMAAETLKDFKRHRPDVDVHTVTVILDDLIPQLAIVGTDQELDEVRVEATLS